MKEPSHENILEQLTLILSSPRFSGSSVLSEFLDFAVRETLDGRGHALKEYTIGVHALGKDPDFNPQLDSIVRIHAGRLRRALKEYYYEDGMHDPIIISIPKGSYIPVFDIRTNLGDDPDARLNGESGRIEFHIPGKQADTNHSSSKGLGKSLPPNKPSIAVLAFKKIGSGEAANFFSKSISEFLCTELTQFESLKVISFHSSAHAQLGSLGMKDIGKMLGADYVFTGTTEEAADHFRLFVQLNCCESGQQLWARAFEKPKEADNYWAFQAKVVEGILAASTGVNGAIAKNEMKKYGPFSMDTGTLGFWYNQFSYNPDLQILKQAKQYYQEVLKEDSGNALAMSYLSCLHSTELFMPGLTPGKGNPGIEYATTALRLDPRCQHAYQSLAFNMLVQRRNDECVHALHQGLEINPNSMEYRGAMAAFLIFAGSFEDGIQMLHHVARLSPVLPWWQTMSYSYYSFYRESYEDALFWADRVNVNVAWVPVIKAATYANLNRQDKVKETLKELSDQHPYLKLSDQNTVKKLFHSEQLISKLESGISKALAINLAYESVKRVK